MYTLKSMSNGKYISFLSGRTHEDVFSSFDLDDAYIWNTLEMVEKEREFYKQCLIIKLGN